MTAIRDGGGPAKVSAERIWALLPHIPEEDAEPEQPRSDTLLGPPHPTQVRPGWAPRS